MADFGELLKDLRKKQTPPVTQADIAQGAGIGAPTVSDWERGSRKPPARDSVLVPALRGFEPDAALQLVVAAGQDRAKLEFSITDDSDRAQMLAKLAIALNSDDADEVVSKISSVLNSRSSGVKMQRRTEKSVSSKRRRVVRARGARRDK